MKKILAEVMGVGSVVHPMCRNSCVAFKGLFMDLAQYSKLSGMIPKVLTDLNTADPKAAKSSTNYIVISETYQLMMISFMEANSLKTYRMVTLPMMTSFSYFPLMVLSSMPIKCLIVGYIFG